jgi:NTE family protein
VKSGKSSRPASRPPGRTSRWRSRNLRADPGDGPARKTAPRRQTNERSRGFLGRALDPNNLRSVFDALSVGSDILRALREDSGFLSVARRTLFPLPTDREPVLEADPFPNFAPLDFPALRRLKLGLVVSGGSGATASVVGVQRVFEEAGIRPTAIAASSGSVLFAALWACGLDSAAVARFWLTLPRSGYVDPDWRSLVLSAGRALGGWAGLLRGDALERSLRALIGDLRLGETTFPFSMPAWNVDLNRVEIFGSHATPDLPVAVAMRVAVAIPIFVEPVRVGEHLYGDGGIVNIFPVRPVMAADPDLLVGLNCYLPEGFEGENVTGWHQRSFAVLRASGQLRWSGMVALAREQALLAGERLVLLHPVPYAEVRGAHFYETFVDRTRWPHFMRAGRSCALAALSTADHRRKPLRQRRR